MTNQILKGLHVFCVIGFVLMLLSTVGCSTLVRQNATTGIAIEGIRASAASREEVKDAVPSDSDCNREARMFMFVSNLPGISTVYQVDRYLAAKFPNQNAPRNLAGTCVLNPFNVAQGAH